jgi:hypothetical protein
VAVSAFHLCMHTEAHDTQSVYLVPFRRSLLTSCGPKGAGGVIEQNSHGRLHAPGGISFRSKGIALPTIRLFKSFIARLLSAKPRICQTRVSGRVYSIRFSCPVVDDSLSCLLPRSLTVEHLSYLPRPRFPRLDHQRLEQQRLRLRHVPGQPQLEDELTALHAVHVLTPI